MGPEVGFSEMLLIGVVALLVVGPKDLPMLMRKVGEWMRKLRNMATEFRHSFDEIARQTELDELRKEVDALRQLNPINDVKREIENAAKLGQDYYKDVEYEFTKDTSTIPIDAPDEAAQIEQAPIVEKPKKPRKPRAKKPKPEGEIAS
jgi:sec-independent protein translocase protein TatB